MDFGVYMFPTDYAIRPDDLAREVEVRGFESIWFPEHTHIPASRRSTWPGGGDLPPEYWHSYDPFVALTAAAAVTTNLKLGTGICLVMERDPIVTAKAWLVSTAFPMGGFCSESGAAGTPRRCRTTAPTSAAGGGCCGRTSWP